MQPAIDARNPVWPASWLPVTGIAYVATGRRFADEAAQAAAQLRKTNPGLLICLITDQPDYQPVFWDHLVVVTNPHLGFRDKLLMGLCPYERFLYLDTDTFVVGDITEMLGLLKRFDFVGHQLFEGHDRPLPGIPDAFPEFQGGVIGLRRSPATADFFARWLASYDAHYALNCDGHYDYSNASDQKTLRLTVWQTGVSVGVIGPEYDFTPHHLDFACAPVRIIHGRGQANLVSLERRLNAHLGNRIYVPSLDTVIHNDTLTPELRRLWVMVSLQLLRKVGVCLTPLALRNWLRRSALVRRTFLRNRFGEPADKPDPKWHQPSSR